MLTFKTMDLRKNPTEYVRKMMTGFSVPRSDALAGCLLAVPSRRPTWDAGIYISTQQSNEFYRDIFEFWVRALFCFVEDAYLGDAFQKAIPVVQCTNISATAFSTQYYSLLDQRLADEGFRESQQYPQTYIELRNRKFTKCVRMVGTLIRLKSDVSHSDGEFVSYFVMVRPGTRARLVTVSCL